MIVREQRGTFTLIKQHDHALLSGWLAAHWGNQTIPAPPAPSEALILATRLHDIGWMELDRVPAWDGAGQEPIAFKAMPPSRRAPYYTHGIDLVEQQDKYAALLCSRHYVSFFSPDNETAQEAPVAQFLAGERTREARLQKELVSAGREAEVARLEFDLGLLKLWDHLSLYVALNNPGVSKKSEHPWYRDGFNPTHVVYSGGGPQAIDGQRVQFQARWLDNTHIALEPFPFAAELACTLATRKVTRAAIQAEGVAAAYEMAPHRDQSFTFVPEPARA